jgi:hypothetical protein
MQFATLCARAADGKKEKSADSLPSYLPSDNLTVHDKRPEGGDAHCIDPLSVCCVLL